MVSYRPRPGEVEPPVPTTGRDSERPTGTGRRRVTAVEPPCTDSRGTHAGSAGSVRRSTADASSSRGSVSATRTGVDEARADAASEAVYVVRAA
ncbi:hypothetical protein BRC93_06240 [Halobacteriales archaeon QS_5_70_15]|nr:MAG: hypothetical protein BRC93_06240 [Halobacteriales archaeon QS_5_70_15]